MTTNIYGTIYQLTNTVNGKKYIGQATTNKNTDWHKRCARDLKYPHNDHLRRAVDVHGITSFISSSLDIAYSPEELNQKEIYWINHLNTLDSSIGYNKRIGGNGGPVSDETRTLLSQKLKGRVFTDQHKLRLRQPKSVEHRRKLREASTGKISHFKDRHHTQKTKRLLSDSHEKKAYPALMHRDTGKVIPAGTNRTQLCKRFGLDKGRLADVINGKYKQHHGWYLFV